MSLLLDDTLYSRLAHFISIVAGEKVNIGKKQEIKNTVPPTFIPSSEDEKYVTCGLCNVARQVFKYSINSEENKERKSQLQLFLGYKQNCLKGCAAISNWTKFCEVHFPVAASKLIGTLNNGVSHFILPEEFVQLEKEFMVPKKTANVAKHHLAGSGDWLSSSTATDINMVMETMTRVLNTKPCIGVHHNSLQKTIVENIEEVKRKKQVFWPYICGFDITIADLLVLGVIAELLSVMPCFCVVKDFFIFLPNISSWFLRCLSKPTVADALSNVWQASKNQFCFNLHTPIFSTDYILESINHFSLMKKSNTKHMHSKITKGLPSILTQLSDHDITPTFNTNSVLKTISWDELPPEVNPTEGELNPERALRKRQQIENMVSLVLPLLDRGEKMVDFCAGGGHLGIVIAYLRPDCQVTILENKEESINRALIRIKKLSLQNVSLHLSNLEYFVGEFSVGVALHACGSATDLVLQKCFSCNASFVISPCCYGSIKSSHSLTYPKSKKFKFINEDQYLILSHSADQTSSDFDSEYSKQGKRCMLYVDYDRMVNAEELGVYETSIFSMLPQSCSPKNNLLLGKSGKKS